MNLKEITRDLLKTVSGFTGEFAGAFNIREDSGCAGRKSTEHIQIKPHREGLSGLEVHVAPGTKGERVYIPACVTHGSVNDLTYNDFYIGENADVVIVAGCGVHTDDGHEAAHNGIHRFFVEKGARVVYEEKHIGTGEGTGKKRIDPVSDIYLEEGATMIMDTVQLGGVDTTIRKTTAVLKEKARLQVQERLMTGGDEQARTEFLVTLEGEDSAVDIVSRSVARGRSRQEYISKIVGKVRSTGHSACDAILGENAVVLAQPSLDALSPEAMLIHEAAIGKIAGEQITKLRTLGLTEEEAERKIIDGFLR